MSNHNEMAMQDAPAGLDTQYSFEPHSDGSYNAANNTFMGSLGTNMDVDWIKIELQAGKEYTINVDARPTEDDATTQDDNEEDSGLIDSILMILDSKGSMIDMNDDEDGAKGMLNSTLKFTPEEDGVYYIAVSAYAKNPLVMNDGDYTVEVMERVLGPADINGTPMNDKLSGTDQGEEIAGMGGDDSLYGMGGDDDLSGGAGDDLLVGGPGADKLSGGTNSDRDANGDTISYAYSMEGVTINLTTGSARGGDAEGDTIVSDRGKEDHIEHVQGSNNDDSLTGNRGDNMLWGLGGNDELDGEDGDDTLSGGAGNDDLDGGDGVDSLNGGYGADMLTGGDGSDTASYAGSMMGVTVRLHSFQSMGGDAEGDTFAGRVDADYTNEDGDDFTASLADIEHLMGSANDDILAGDFRNNTIDGGDGDDKIYGGPGAGADAKGVGVDDDNSDELSGGKGNDMIFGGLGNDTLNGGAGDDMLHGGPGDDTYDGGTGDDMIYADEDDMSIDGGADEGMVMGGNDTVSYARLEDGVIRRLDDNVTITDVTFSPGITISNVENITGSQGDDALAGSNDVDNVIEGGEGGDMLEGGTHGMGGDTLSYASSDDWVRVTLGEGTDTAIASRGHASGDEATGFENVTGSAHDDDLTGNTGPNVLKGGDGDDELVGGAGADTLEGGAGADELDGGVPRAENQDNDEMDVLSYASSDAGVNVNLTTSNVSGGHADGDTLATVETDHDGDGDDTDVDEDDKTDEIDVSTFERVTGSMHDDSLTGDYRMNVLNGMGGDDALRGLAGWDMLIGGPGADRLDGGESGAREADDEADPAVTALAEDVDWAVYRHAMDDVTVNLDTRMGTGGDAMGDVLVGIEVVWGSDNNEEGEGDTFIASAGADMIHGDLGSDTVSYEASEMGVTVALDNAFDDDTWDKDPTDGALDTATAVNGLGLPDDDLAPAIAMLDDAGTVIAADGDPEDNVNGAAGDRLGGIENLTGSSHGDSLTGDDNANTLKGMGGIDTLVGGAGNDKLHGGDGDDTLSADSGMNTLMGDAGDDTITGGSGADTINGGAGDDQMTGGGGNDTFVFSPDDGDGDDVITGLTTLDNDAIDLSAYLISDPDDLLDNIDIFGGNVRLDLTEYGGGKIILDGVDSLDDIGDVDTDTGALTALDMATDENDNGEFDAGEGGFIL